MILRKKKLILTWGSTTFTASTGRGFKPSILTLSYLGNFNFIPGHFSNNKKLQKKKIQYNKEKTKLNTENHHLLLSIWLRLLEFQQKKQDRDTGYEHGDTANFKNHTTQHGYNKCIELK